MTKEQKTIAKIIEETLKDKKFKDYLMAQFETEEKQDV